MKRHVTEPRETTGLRGSSAGLPSPKRPDRHAARLALTLLVLSSLAAAPPAAAASGGTGTTRTPAGGNTRRNGDTLRFERFGSVAIYGQTPHPAHVALFVSGDGGWNQGVVDMARSLATLDTLVVGVDITHYLKEIAAAKEECTDAAADFEALSEYVQRERGFPEFTQPVLVGYSSGATLVYAVLSQSPPGTFLGGISLGFCPDLPLTRPMCRGNGPESSRSTHPAGYSFAPAPWLATPWIVLQGEMDQVCSPTVTDTFVGKTGNARIVRLPGVGHGYSVPKNWLPQFREAFQSLVASAGREPAPPDGVDDLPLVELPATGGTKQMAVIVSGDGGWSSLDRQVGETLAGRGIPVVGFNSLRYFWNRRTPEEMGRDLDRVIRHYLQAWDKEQVILIGYSLGADVLPFMASRLSADIVGRTSLTVLIGLAGTVDFEFHVVSNWLGATSPNEVPVAPEVKKLAGRKMLCFYGEKESDDICPKLEPGLVTAVRMPGGHHLGGEYLTISDRILRELDEGAGPVGN